MFPTYTKSWHSDFLKPKYRQIRQIKLEGYVRFDHYIRESQNLTDEDIMMILEDLPSCFVKDYDWGLGFTQSFRHIVYAVENLSPCTQIVISNQNATESDNDHTGFYISAEDFDSIRLAIARNCDYQSDSSKICQCFGDPQFPGGTGRRRSHSCTGWTKSVAATDNPGSINWHG